MRKRNNRQMISTAKIDKATQAILIVGEDFEETNKQKNGK